MKIAHSKTFRSGNSDAIRLPKEVSIGADVEVEIIRTGDVLTIRPKSRLTPKELAELLESMPKPKQVEKRQAILFPKRKGL
jgi:antitoxin VapB